jgi:hypothetical protein
MDVAPGIGGIAGGVTGAVEAKGVPAGFGAPPQPERKTVAEIAKMIAKRFMDFLPHARSR